MHMAGAMMAAMKRAKWLWLPAAAAVGAWLVLLQASCQRPAPPPGAERFLLIVCDSLRADHVGCYGSNKGLTPHIDAFSKRAVRFENAYAACSWTVPSNAALMTGKYPHEVQDPGKMRVARTASTMAEYFLAAGYATAGFSAHKLMSGTQGFAQGFQTFQCERLQDEEMAARCMKWLRAHHDDRFFVLLYLLDPHWPYDPEQPGAHLVPRDAEVRDRVAQGYIPLDPEVRVPRIVAQPEGDREMSLGEVEYLHALYNGDVASVDERIGRVLQVARDIPGLVVAVASDHGEEWLDHGGLSHLYTLYDELLRIPLLISAPGLEPATVTNPVSNLDVLPTFLALAGLSAPDGLRGASLLPPHEPGPRPLVAEVGRWNPSGVVRYSVRLGSQTLIWTQAGLSDEPEPPPQGRFERYDFVRDPGQKAPLPLDAPGGSELRRLLHASNPFAGQATGAAQRPELDAETLEELRALGYVGK